ncbi:MAG TPA: SulP family inorganic anion transporter [Rhizomicrobium sp.]|nr:SulP family inorganic anion transporter [Rhizomicrobium sp.]
MAGAAQQKRGWPILRSFAGWTWNDLGGDLGAGLTLAAIAIPEQMATARLGGFAPETGLFLFIAGSIAFAVFGANRYLSSGADSTITPIFAGALAAVAAQGSFGYAALAAVLAIAVGVILIASGLARLGWIASFLSAPVTTGFLAGVAIHIVVSQLPGLLDIASPGPDLLARARFIATHLGDTNFYALLLGAIVFGLSVAGDRWRWRVPGPLIGLATTMLLVALLGSKGVPVVGATAITWPHPAWPQWDGSAIGKLAWLSLLIAVIVMVQTAATTRAFTSLADPQDVNRDFIGVGAGSVLAGLFGLFPVNASPPRTAAVEEAGGSSQLAGLTAVLCLVLLLALGRSLLRYVPIAALAGILFAVALRLARPSIFALVLRQSWGEFLLIIATMAAIVALPIQTGVAVGIGLSLMHGLWTITRTHVIELEHVPGTTVWWTPMEGRHGEKLRGVRVVTFAAPLFFLNADELRRDLIDIIEGDKPSLIVFEASGVSEVDFTAARALLDILDRCRQAEIRFAIARLISPRAQQALRRFGVAEELGPQGFYHSVAEAIDALHAHQREG